MANNMQDLNDHLFAQLDRLSNDQLTPEEIESEVKRSKAIVDIADQVTENTKAKLVAAKLYAEHGNAILPHLPMIGGPKNEK